MKLDPTVMRSMTKDDYIVMEAIEHGMKDHEIVPIQLITNIASLRYGGVMKRILSLLRDKLISHERTNGLDGYRLTNSGYDILALYTLKTRYHLVYSIGQKIGTGKESDIYLACDKTGQQIVLKFHRLGRTSFRNVRAKRDYFNNSGGTSSGAQQNRAHSWLYLSHLSAQKEYMFMKAVHDIVHINIPKPLGYNRHIIVMSLIRGIPLYQLFPKQLSIEQCVSIYYQIIYIINKLTIYHGLIHCDLNEFNLLIDLSGIQHLATDNTNDPYVRNSGSLALPTAGTSTNGSTTAPTTKLPRISTNMMDDAASTTISLLSRPVPWLQEESIVAHATDIVHNTDDTTTAANTTIQPIQYLSNGQPKPIVTLIDFPQMISIEHPNAQEYYERDIECIQRFFIKKLQLSKDLLDSLSTNPNEFDNNDCNDNVNSNNTNNTCKVYKWEEIIEQAQIHSISNNDTIIEEDDENDDDDNNTINSNENDTKYPMNDITIEQQQQSSIVVDTAKSITSKKSITTTSKSQSQSQSQVGRHQRQQRQYSGRLDKRLRASGFNKTVESNSGLELYYFESSKQQQQEQQEQDQEQEQPADDAIAEEDVDSDNENDDEQQEEMIIHNDTMIAIGGPDVVENDDNIDVLNGEEQLQQHQQISISGIHQLELLSIDKFDHHNTDSQYICGVDSIVRADDESASIISNTTCTTIRNRLSREEMILIAKERITKQIENDKKKLRMKGTFRRKNNNKSISKGKQILTDSGF